MKPDLIPGDGFSRLDIIDAHELQVKLRAGFLECRCSCGDWEQWLKAGYAPVHEQAKDRFLKHVQQTRDALRGTDHREA